MTQKHTLLLPSHTFDPASTAAIRFGAFGGDKMVITTDLGAWQILDKPDFYAFIAGTTDPGSDAYAALAGQSMFAWDVSPDDLAAQTRRRKRHLGVGPAFHAIRLQGPQGTLSIATVKSIVDHAMLSTSSSITFQLLGQGAPDLDLLGFLHQYATEKNRYEGKNLRWQLHTSPAELDEATAAWLAERRFAVHGVILGDQAFHDAHASAAALPSFAAIAQGVALLHTAGEAKRRSAEMVVLSIPFSLQGPDAASVVRALQDLGVTHAIATHATRGPEALSTEAWARTLHAWLEALTGTQITDDALASTAAAILRADGAEDATLQSPNLGSFGYNEVGQVFASATALQVEDPEPFLLGNVGHISYRDSVTHPTMRALALASLTETLPGLSDHWAAPFLSVDPVRTWVERGDLFALTPESAEIASDIETVRTILAHLHAEGDTAALLRSWAP